MKHRRSVHRHYSSIGSGYGDTGGEDDDYEDKYILMMTCRHVIMIDS